MRVGLYKRRKHPGVICAVLFSVLLFMGIAILIMVKMRPVFLDYAEKYSENMANNLVNDAIAEVYSDNRYNGLSETKGGNIKTVETDTSKINRLKSELNQKIQNSINDVETIYIPIGSVTGVYFLSGSGFKVPVKVCPVGVVSTELRDKFTSAGINQVYHKIYLDVSIEMSYMGIMIADTRTVKTTALVSETVIVGDTPQYYGSSGEIAVQ
ncbi:MAG: sporulation protein YunB [Clostridia bacterium]|nr:sporulation protein YunB [Clostridia bacterium]